MIAVYICVYIITVLISVLFSSSMVEHSIIVTEKEIIMHNTTYVNTVQES